MEKRDLVLDMKTFMKGSSFITKADLARYIGVKQPRYIEKYLINLEMLSGKYYFIPEVAGILKENCIL